MNLQPKLSELASILGISPHQIQICGSQCTIQGNDSQVFIDHSHPYFYSLRHFDELIFQNCHFKAFKDNIALDFLSKSILFSNCHFLDKTILLNFEGDVEFDRVDFYNQVQFHHSKFQGNFKLSNSFFYQEVILFEASFQSPPKDKKSDNSKKTIFSKVTFKEKVDINGATFYGETRFSEIIFEKNFYIARSIQNLQFLAGRLAGGDGAPTKFLNNAFFQKVRIDGNLEISDTHFEGSVNFDDSVFKNEVFFSNNVFNNFFVFYKNECTNLIVRNSTFGYYLTLKELEHLKFLEFFSCTFLHFLILNEIDFCLINTDFSHSIFKGGVNFANKTFLNVNFFQAQFEKNMDFDYATFIEDANFQKTRFLESASFYGAKFEKIPNFSQSSFQKELNLVNTNLSFDYEDVKAKILQTHKDDNQDKKTLSFIINDFRDSFRIFKNTLSKEGNFLDASNYHRVELYCKEIELDSKNPPIPSKEWIDMWQLRLYRHTSEHHTDLLKIISWVIVAIGIFGVMNFGIKYIQDPSIIKKLNPYGITSSFVESILALPFCMTTKKPFFKLGRYLVILSSIPTLWIACYKPTLIFGAMNLIDKSPRSGFENLILVLYTLVMILLLFSLQKTARKNSIVPN